MGSISAKTAAGGLLGFLLLQNAEALSSWLGLSDLSVRIMESKIWGSVMSPVVQALAPYTDYLAARPLLCFTLGAMIFAFWDWLSWPIRRLWRLWRYRNERALMGQLVQFRDGAMGDAHAAAHQLLGLLAGRAIHESRDEKTELIGIVFAGAIRDRANLEFAKFVEATSIVAADVDDRTLRSAQAALGEAYRNYQSMSTAIETTGRFVGYAHPAGDHLRAWRELDGAYLMELRKLAASPSLDVLKSQVKAVGYGEGVRSNLARTSPLATLAPPSP